VCSSAVIGGMEMDYPASRVYDEAGERCDFAGVLAGRSDS
jgi:hypothetical protein